MKQQRKYEIPNLGFSRTNREESDAFLEKKQDPTTLPRHLDLIIQNYKLKPLLRQGWLYHDITPDKCESVAEHSFGVAFLALLLGPLCVPDLDQYKLLRLSLIHDLAESSVGDLTPHDPEKLLQTKVAKELDYFTHLSRITNRSDFELLFREFSSESTTPEAKFIQQLDKLDMIIQATIFHELSNQPSLEEFLISSESLITHPQLREIYEMLKSRF